MDHNLEKSLTSFLLLFLVLFVFKRKFHKYLRGFWDGSYTPFFLIRVDKIWLEFKVVL